MYRSRADRYTVGTFPEIASLITLAMGLSGLMGWIFDVPLLRSVLPGAVEMKANTAIGLILSAAGLYACASPSSSGHTLARVCGLFVMALGIATSGEYLYGWHLGIDELLFRDTGNAYNVIRGRMSPYSAFTFAMTGLALAILPWRRWRALASLASIFVMVIGGVSILGYLWNAAELVTDRLLPPVALNTGLAFFLLGAGIFRSSMESAKHWRVSQVESRILASFLGAFVLLVLMGGYTYKASVGFENSARWVRHTQDVRIAIGELDSAISDIESVQRIYILTGNRDYKEEYGKQVEAIGRDAQNLAQLLADDPEQMRKLRKLESLVAHRIELLSQHVSVFEHAGPAAMAAAISSDDEIQTLQAIRSLTSNMNDAEKELLSQRDVGLDHDRALMLVTLLVTLALAAGVFISLFFWIRREMVARSRAERQLRMNEENLSVTLDSIGDAVIATDSEGRVTRMNTVAVKLTGWSLADALGKPIANVFNIVNQQTHQPASVPVAATLAQGVIHGLANDTVLIARDGTEYPIADSCAPIRNRDGAVIGAVLVFRDVTAEYASQAALQEAKEKAEMANRAKDSFLATMSHEIRTPLAGMLGMLELLSLTPMNQEQEATLRTAWDSARNLLRIVNDILDWSKIQEGKLDIVPVSSSLPRLLKEVTNTYLHLASSKALTLRQYIDPRISEAHAVDALRLSQVLGNFISNAIKFTPSGEVVLSAVLLEKTGDRERIRFSVKDTGIGISREAQPYLFQRFQQGDINTARMYGGTGLGLAICLSLMELMDGQIELASEYGQGSTFSIVLVLPVSSMPQETSQVRDLTVKQKSVKPLFVNEGEAPQLLIVDDHPINRDLLGHQLKLLGLRTEAAEHGEDALAKWCQGGFALVITDCHMPNMDGYALSRAIRAIEVEEKRPHTPVIAWTANAMDEEVQNCRSAGMDALLTKPASLPQLREMLAKWLPAASGMGKLASASVAGPIDFDDLGKLMPDGTKHKQILRDFYEHLCLDFDKLTRMMAQDDCQGITATAHRMKGSSRMIGARVIADVCEKIEQAAGKGEASGVQGWLPRLQDAIAKMGSFIQSLA